MFDVTDLLLGVLAAVLGWSTFISNRKKDTRMEGAQEATLHSDLKYIKELLQDVRSDMKEITKAVDAHAEKIAKCEEQLHSAFVRIERLEKQLDSQREE
jgi:chromosome segregation ATPase